MKILFISIIVYVSITSLLNAQWSKCNCSYVDNIYDIESFGESILAATQRGVIKSDDRGVTWYSVNEDLKNYMCKSIIVLSGTIYVGTEKGILHSTDKGKTWLREYLKDTSIVRMMKFKDGIVVNTGPKIIRITPSNGNREELNVLNGDDTYTYIVTSGSALYCTTNKMELQRYTNNEGKWEKVLENKKVNYVFAHENMIYAATNMGEVYRSTNDGIDWKEDSVADTRGSFGLINTSKGIFALSYKGIYISTNRGSTWDRFNDDLDKDNGISTIWGEEDILLFGIYSAGISRSTNGGMSWLRTGTLCLPFFTLDVVDNVMYGYSYEVHSTNNRTETWKKCKGCGIIQGNSKVLFSLFSEGNKQNLYRSYDKGSSWDTILHNTPGQQINGYVYHNEVLYVAMSKNVMFSNDSGKTWSISITNDTNIQAIVSSKKRVFVQLADGRVFFKEDGDNEWKDIHFPFRTFPRTIIQAADEIDSNIFLRDDGISRTPNEGRTWYYIHPSQATGKEFIINNQLVFGSGNRIFVKDVTGKLKYSWFDFKSEVHAITRLGNTMYASTSDGMWRADISTLPTSINDDNEISNKLPIRMYPNPTSNTITVQTQNDTPYSYLITNQLGETVQTGIVEQGGLSHQISVDTLPSGAYVFVSQKDGSASKQMFSVIK